MSANAAYDSDAYQEFRQAVTDLTGSLRTPSLSVAVTTSDTLLYADAFGWADLAARRRATTRTSYLWFSMTKIATATAALRLVDEGRLDLAEPIVSYLPWYPLGSSSTSTPVVGQLLSHTAGLANPLPLRWVRPAEAPAPDPNEMLRRLVTKRTAFRRPVGGDARYSNLGYLVLAQVIAGVSGEPFESYVRRAVLEPAGMIATGFSQPSPEDAATGYLAAGALARRALNVLLPEGIVGSAHGRRLTAFHPFLVNGAGYGGLVGDVVDAARLAALHLGDGQIDDSRVLGPDGTRRMRDIQSQGKPFDLGLGWFRKPEHRDCSPAFVEHYGSGGGFFNAMRIYPALNLGIVLMANTTRAYDVHRLCEILRQVPWDGTDSEVRHG